MLLHTTIRNVIVITWDKPENRDGYPLLLEGLPSRRKKGGLANGYIRGFNPVLYTFGCSCRVVLHNLQGQKEIAVITRNNDG